MSTTTSRRRTRLRWLRALISLSLMFAAAWASCSGGNNAKTDASTDTDSDTDTDTGEPEWGDAIPCQDEAGEGEICIPGGDYMLGCMPGDTECEEWEKPSVIVRLSPFFIEETEPLIVEVVDFLNDVKDEENVVAGYNGIAWDEGDGQIPLWGLAWGDSYTVLKNDEGVYELNMAADEECSHHVITTAVAGGFSWMGAKMFCEWKGMQLPTEAQWEAAARGQTLNRYPCGTDIPSCWYGYYSCCDDLGECPDEGCMECCVPFSPQKAGESCLSPYGVNGMYGNAREWTADLHDDGHAWAEGLTDPVQTNQNGDAYQTHVSKDGSIFSTEKSLRISYRGGSSTFSDQGSRHESVRCVRPDEPTTQPDAGTPDAGADAGKK